MWPYLYLIEFILKNNNIFICKSVLLVPRPALDPEASSCLSPYGYSLILTDPHQPLTDPVWHHFSHLLHSFLHPPTTPAQPLPLHQQGLRARLALLASRSAQGRICRSCSYKRGYGPWRCHSRLDPPGERNSLGPLATSSLLHNTLCLQTPGPNSE